ncbi:hypothetical protein J7T55_000522 [Diaporthe amygdali]|uniref:uncharacterized protein n=1 Tax=Phomopsis amygdali TaxID=1214568 RepID=UPI0022FE477F|nr:uncharacterized protein J7T55_000522 [Diaporthe amygdali]KAJ0104171.1 hypothetical protein J7T55_000522 [Diaporthe amygdali]
MVEKHNPENLSRQSTLRQTAGVSDGFNYSHDNASSPLDLGASDEAPPAYGEVHDQLNLSQAGFNAGAAVTDDGRVNINISQTNRRLSELLAPALKSQLLPSQKTPSGPLPPAYIPPSLGGLPGQTPPPKLNLVIQIVGSRGDVQPFVALGKVLKDTYGHRVRIATHATFQKFVEENGLEFFCIGGDPAELMAFMVKNPGLMPGIDALKSGEITKRRKGIEQIVLGTWRSCIEAGNGLGPPVETDLSNEPLGDDYSLPGNPEDKPFVADAIIANPPSFGHIHIAEKMGIPLHMMFTMPWSPTRAFPHPLANIQSTDTDTVMTNFVSYALVEMMTWQGLGDVINRFRTKVLDLEPLSLIWAPGLLSRLQIPTTYCWSPALIPKPNDWGREISISGFYFLDLATSYTPEPELAAFLESGPPPVYIGFGSIVVDDPNKLTRMIFDAVTQAGVRALVSKGWGGIGADSVGIPEGVYMLGNCPHDWLFKKVSCVVHHGGAGTSAAGIKTGTPTVVVPFFGDQPFWGAMIAKAGAGPAPIPYKQLTAEKLAEAITSALKPETQARAKELGEKIRQEKGADQGAKSFHDFLDYDNLRCSIAPSRTAVWRVRRTKVRLSALAAAVLVKEEHDTEEQPWDPISAVTAALVGDMGSIAMAIGDIPRDWYKTVKKSSSGSVTPKKDDSSATSNDAASSSQLTLPSDGASTWSAQPSALLSPPAQSDTSSSQGRDPSILGGSTLQASSASKSPVRSPTRSATSPSPSGPSSSQGGKPKKNIDVETALGMGLDTGKNVTRIVETGFKSPMNFCMGLAKGFRNAPRLYNDDTIRKPDKVTGLGSGVVVAWKELGLGFYDGVSGLVTQPYKGAQKQGGQGFIKGVGKGIGGLILKPAAGIWAIPAYMMKGVHAEIRSKFHHSVDKYVVTSRILQGQADLRSANVEEMQDIIVRFNSMSSELRGLYVLKYKEKVGANETPSGLASTASQDDLDRIPDSPPKTGFWNTRHMSLEERRKLHEQRDAWKKKKREEAAAGVQPTAEPEDPGMERAIRESVNQTSRGDPNEDAMIEAQIRSSVKEMRRIAEEQKQQEQQRQMGDWKQRPSEPSEPPAWADEKRVGLGAGGEEITDEEFEALIAEAARQSVIAQGHSTEDESFERALQESRETAQGHGEGGQDEELRKALEESERAHQADLARRTTERSEEEVIMEYVKKQSLAEEEFRRQKAKGKQPEGAGGDDEDDEDLKKAIEESLTLSGKQGGPSA